MRFVVASAEVLARARLAEDGRLALPAGEAGRARALVAVPVRRHDARAAVRTCRAAQERRRSVVLLRPNEQRAFDDPVGKDHGVSKDRFSHGRSVYFIDQNVSLHTAESLTCAGVSMCVLLDTEVRVRV